jgi:hypothetical protein
MTNSATSHCPHPVSHALDRPLLPWFPSRCLARWSRRAVKPLLLLGAAVIVQGCAKPYGTVVRQFGETPICCDSLAELPVEPLQLGDKKSFELGDGSPAYRFDTGKSYFRAFLLPQGPYPYRATVRSFLVGDTIKAAYLFFPQLLTLDANRKVVRTTVPETFSLERTELLETMRETGGIRHKLEGGLTFTGENRNERYLIVLTTDELLRGKTPVSTVGDVPMFILGSAETVPVHGSEVQVPHAPGGRLNVSLETIVAPNSSEIGASEGKPEKTAAAPHSAVRPGGVTVRLADGTVIGVLEPGRTTLAAARHMYENAGVVFGPEHGNAAMFTIGSVTLVPKRLFTPPGTHHQLYFDNNGIVVLFIDGAPVGLPRTGRAFLQLFPAAHESGRTLGSYQLQTSLTPCVTLIAGFRVVDDTLDSAAFGYSCPER